MAETLVFENENGQIINEIIFRRTIKGIPSLVTKFYVKNQSENNTFQGDLNIVPAYGRSHSGDASISDSGQVWMKVLPILVPPLDRVEIKARVIPIQTPQNSTGRASLVITDGQWL